MVNRLVGVGMALVLCLAGAVWSIDDEADLTDCCIGTRGDINYDGSVEPDPLDLVYLVDFLFNGGLPPLCRTEADFNGDGSIEPDPLDLTALVDYLYAGGAGPAGCVTLGVKSTLTLPGIYFQPIVNVSYPGETPRGAALNWTARYSLDPGQPATFRCRWRMYGPYTAAELSFLETNVFTYAYETYDGQVFDLGDTIWICRDTITSEYDAECEPCQQLVITRPMDSTIFGQLVPMFDVEDPNFKGLFYDRVAVESGVPGNPYLYQPGDTAFNLFGKMKVDSTFERYFVAWLEASDEYGNVEATPSFKSFRAINAAFEREILLLDYTGYAGAQQFLAPLQDTIKSFWGQLLDNIRPEASFSLDRDFRRRWGQVTPTAPTDLLSHKMCIVFADGPANGSLFEDDVYIRAAVELGVGLWVIQLSPIKSTLDSKPADLAFESPWAEYLGVESQRFNGWMCSACAPILPFADPADCPGGRIEDFDGADAIAGGFPHLTVDTSLLHSRYPWGSSQATLDSAFAWEPYYEAPPLGALPGVCSIQPTSGAEILYTYSSIYGNNHPNGFGYSFEGSAVAVRTEVGNVRTAYFSFTPPSLAESDFAVAGDSVLTWLLQPWQE